MNYGSVCSGIEAASVAWKPLGWECAFVSEIEPFPCAVLKHHYPNVPNLGDMTRYKEWPDASIDVLVGGTPCQSFSVAGLRKGLADPRGNLALVYLGLVDRLRPKWVVWENVPGVLSSGGGRDFGSFLGGLAELGYGWAYRVLDAQYFGVPQRRRRVFVVGYAGDWRRAAAVLFESHSMQGHPPPSREARQEIAPTIRAGTPNGGAGHGARSGDSKDELIIPICGTLNASGAGTNRLAGQGNELDFCIPVAHALRGEGHDASEDGTGRGVPLTLAIRGRGDSHDLETREDGTANAILTPNGGRAGIGVGAVAIPYDLFQITAPINRQNLEDGDPCHTLAKDNAAHAAVLGEMQVRRLTPRECERLQGFPDDYTLIPHRGKPAVDGPRYKALGNSMAVPVMRWIGERIQQVEAL